MIKTTKITITIAAIILLTSIGIFASFKYSKNQTESSIYSVYLDKTAPESPILLSDQSPYHLSIEKINLSAPINININGNHQSEYNKALETGVAHLLGSALPGNPGNAVIFGHSSYFRNAAGDYKEIFENLNDLEQDDQIVIESKLKKYLYKIIDKQVIPSNKVDIVTQNYSEHKLTLVTCWPIGSNEKRLAITAVLLEQIDNQ